MVLGLLDDFRPVSAPMKLCFIILMSYLLFQSGVSLDTFRSAGINLALSVLWITWLTSATNSLDHMDGACAGTAAVSCLFTFLFAWDFADPQVWLSYLTAAFLGSLLGFLQYNFIAFPAQIFLGNNGALLVGFLLSSMTILGNWSTHWWSALAVPCSASPLRHYARHVLRYKNGVVKTPQGHRLQRNDHTSHRLSPSGIPSAKYWSSASGRL